MFKKIVGGRELVPGRELVHHHWNLKSFQTNESESSVNTDILSELKLYHDI